MVEILEITWIPFKFGELKFNIDGTVNGSFGKAGIGGYLRNENSRCLVTFSKNVGYADLTTDEIVTILKAVLIFKKSKFKHQTEMGHQVYVCSRHSTAKDLRFVISGMQNGCREAALTTPFPNSKAHSGSYAFQQ
ncbi:hypothetical protein V6N11_022756 [Hibiscus sabdariffa]|uniref:RNase H type-1 domain-containing protein n=1 Tax=Hibiscus sabdariffa TaxID=183260 RepID=A0ABR2TK57_9ROSI